MSDNQPKCGCGERCWAFGKNPLEPCWGKINVSEDFPGTYTHFCDGHGHYEDAKPYTPMGKGRG
jgi:hypothetical protein